MIKSLPPGSSRDVTVTYGPGGGAIYSDVQLITKKPLLYEHANVMVILNPDGGIVMHKISNGTISYPDSIAAPSDVALVQKLFSQQQLSQTTRALDAAEQAKVASVVAYVRKRCPASEKHR